MYIPLLIGVNIMNKRFKYATLLLSVVLLFFVISCSSNETSIEAEKSKNIVKVYVQKPSMTKYPDYFMLSGSIKSHQSSVLSSKIMAQVVDILVEEGSAVKPGQLLIKLDDRESKINIAKHETETFKLKAEKEELADRLEELKSSIQMLFYDQEKYLSEAGLAQSTYNRSAKLFEKEVISQQEFDEVKTKLDAANSVVSKSQAEYNLLMAQKKQLDSKNKQIVALLERNKADMANAVVNDSYTEITSALRGFVVDKFVAIGDMASPGKPLITVENNESMYLEVNVDETSAPLFVPGAEILVVIDAYGNTKIKGIVREVVPAADPGTHTFRVKIDLPPHKAIHSGMYARANVPIKSQNLFITGTAVVQKGQVKGVYVVDSENIARFRVIKVGQDIDGFAEVISGLSEDDNVIISELNNISDGTKVQVLGDK